MLGAIENKLAARAVVGLVRLGFACMDAAERIARWAKARNPASPLSSTRWHGSSRARTGA
jgi:hypothetical protein